MNIGSNINLNTISLPSLISAGEININSNYLLNNFSIAALTSCQNIFINLNSQLSSLSFDSLTNAGSVDVSQNPQITSVNLQNLISANITLDSPLLTSFNISSLALSNGLRFKGNLSSAVINSVLNKCLNIAPSSNKNIYLNGQNPPAPPTGQGITDKATLINQGNYVVTD